MKGTLVVHVYVLYLEGMTNRAHGLTYPVEVLWVLKERKRPR